MTTNISQAAPTLPFVDSTATEWMAAVTGCSASPASRRYSRNASSRSWRPAPLGGPPDKVPLSCPTHGEQLRRGPSRARADRGGARMSMSLPVLLERCRCTGPPIQASRRPARCGSGSPTAGSPATSRSTSSTRCCRGGDVRVGPAGLRREAAPRGGPATRADTTVTAESGTDVVTAGGFVGAILTRSRAGGTPCRPGCPGSGGRIAHVRQRKSGADEPVHAPGHHPRAGRPGAHRGDHAARAVHRPGRHRARTSAGGCRPRPTGTGSPDADRFCPSTVTWCTRSTAAHRIFDALARDYRVPAQLGPWFEPRATSYPLPDPTGGGSRTRSRCSGLLAAPVPAGRAAGRRAGSLRT